MKNEYFIGTRFRVTLKNGAKQTFILANSFESGYVFQLICIDGYDAGEVFGLVEVQEKFEKEMISAIDEKHLIKQVSRNILDFNPDKPIEILE